MCDAMDSLESNQQPKFLTSGTGWISESPTRILIFKKKQVWQNAYMFWTLTAVSKQGVHDFPGKRLSLAPRTYQHFLSYALQCLLHWVSAHTIPHKRYYTPSYKHIILGEDLEATFEFTHLGSCGSVTKSCTPTLRGQGDPKVSQPF